MLYSPHLFGKEEQLDLVQNILKRQKYLKGTHLNFERLEYTVKVSDSKIIVWIDSTTLLKKISKKYVIPSQKQERTLTLAWGFHSKIFFISVLLIL